MQHNILPTGHEPWKHSPHVSYETASENNFAAVTATSAVIFAEVFKFWSNVDKKMRTSARYISFYWGSHVHVESPREDT